MISTNLLLSFTQREFFELVAPVPSSVLSDSPSSFFVEFKMKISMHVYKVIKKDKKKKKLRLKKLEINNLFLKYSIRYNKKYIFNDV